MDDSKTARRIGDGIAVMPGTLISCFLVTVITILLAIFVDHPTIDPMLRPLYFALLFGAFTTIRRREKALRGLSFRLIEIGFLVLTLGFVAGTVMRLNNMEASPHLLHMERGAVFLLGLSLITYGIILLVPDLLERYGGLRENYARTRGQLKKVRRSHNRMYRQVLEAEGFKALGELAAGVAHDLRNPLTIVKATAESLARKERSHAEVDEHVRIIRRNIEKAERTISALLDLGKAREVSVRDTSLRELVTEMSALISVQFRHKKVKLTQPEGMDIRVQTDPKLLLQALLNLLINALHASPEGAEVRLELREFHFGTQSLAAIVVADRGHGLDQAARTQLFTPFFTTKKDGTGLGLLSCRRILDDLGGRIGLFPRNRGGARALVLLPMQPVEALAS